MSEDALTQFLLSYSNAKAFNLLKIKICSTYKLLEDTYLEYELSYTNHENEDKTLNFHACYQMHNHNLFLFSQSTPQIRIIGDPILHRAGISFPTTPSMRETQELQKQIKHAKSVLIRTGGAGIAANQCASVLLPYRFIIVGIFYDSAEHVSGVTKRYPTAKFPPAKIMVNPEVIKTSSETQRFNHGCLSVPCPNRCEVMSPMAITIQYQDPTQDMALVRSTYHKLDAVVLWHELTHILDGKTYMDVTIESLSSKELSQFQKILASELEKRESGSHIPELTIPPFYFSVKLDESGKPCLDQDECAQVTSRMADETLIGLLGRIDELKKDKINTI